MKLLYFSDYHCHYGLIGRKRKPEKAGKKAVKVSFKKIGKSSVYFDIDNIDNSRMFVTNKLLFS